MSDYSRDDIDLATAAEQSSEVEENQEGDVETGEVRSAESAEERAITVEDESRQHESRLLGVHAAVALDALEQRDRPLDRDDRGVDIAELVLALAQRDRCEREREVVGSVGMFQKFEPE